MARREVVLDEDGKKLWIYFPYDEALLPIVRQFRNRRFDRASRAWSCPVTEVVEVVDTLTREKFSFAPAVLQRYIDSGGERTFDSAPTLFAAQPAAFDPAGESMTVSELNRQVHAALLRSFPDEFWLVGEVAGYERNRGRRHAYFELAEKDGDGDHATAVATVTAVMFERTRLEVEALFEASEAGIELRDGIEIRVRVRVDLYEPRGSYQVVVEEVDPVHTMGKLAQKRAKILQELERQGIKEQNLLLPWPKVPLRLGVVTSIESDAYNDFVDELRRIGYAFQLTVVGARMQGQSLERELIGALDQFAANADDYDLVAIVRGGGARSDLMWFDSLKLAVAVARCPIKIISGIGHHRDVSVLDLITHREKTPTAAAQAIVGRVAAFEDQLRELAEQLRRRAASQVALQRSELKSLSRSTAKLVQSSLRLRKETLSAYGRRLVSAGRSRLRNGQGDLGETRKRLERSVTQQLVRKRRERISLANEIRSWGRSALRSARSEFRFLCARLQPEPLRRLCRRQGDRLLALQNQANAVHPSAVLRRGFALIRDADGNAIRSATKVKMGQTLSAELHRGDLSVEVLETRTGDSEKSPNESQRPQSGNPDA